jgi:hypothetical protein
MKRAEPKIRMTGGFGSPMSYYAIIMPQEKT